MPAKLFTVRREICRATRGLNGLIQTTLTGQDVAELIVHAGIPRLEPYSLLQLSFRLRELSVYGKQIS